NHIKSHVWTPFWDFLFCASSLLLAVFYGAALGNVVRGVPLGASGYFFEPLWPNFLLGEQTGILDLDTGLVGLLALAALVMHGALWVRLKPVGTVNDRSGKLAGRSWWAVLVLTAWVTAITFRIQPQILVNFKTWPVGFLFPALAAAGLAGVQFELRRK